MQTIQSTRTYVNILTASCLVMLLLLFLFLTIWVYGGSETSIIQQSSYQIARANSLAKNAESILYRQTDKEQSLVDMQSTLPLFEQTQRGLSYGDASLQLPFHVPDDVLKVVQPSQSDYLAIDTICKTIIQTNTVTDAQLSVLLPRIKSYNSNISEVVQTWKQRIDNAFFMLFVIQSATLFIAFALIVTKYMFITRKMLKRLESC